MNILRKRGTRKILRKNFSEFFLGKTSETSSIFTTDLKKDIFFLLYFRNIFYFYYRP